MSASPDGSPASGLGARFGVWVAAGIFNRHLAFFFVPIAVGLLAFGDLFRESGPGIVVAIIVGTAVGIAVTGGVAEWLLRIGSRSGDTR